ncbi:hypothetical protein GCM10009093_21480 [Brevundimonas terrae]|uniref:HTH tetR-type domain-containing protein n=1 Tax=Brevundimonas terrae TaxID=363631 RepID=A0ABP3I906_9CAUL|nr:TetR family transcriptional regulator [Brevundimonas terrae]NIJ26893.1 AcrR family transcriptional regulator [Brevundimonas terrae]
MTDQITNKRILAKIRTRQRVMDAARTLWATPGSYTAQGIREIAAEAGLSTGSVFSNFDTKEDLWLAVFECPAPIDSALTRAAPEMRRVLQNLIEQRPEVIGTLPAPIAKDWDDAERIIEHLKDLELASQLPAQELMAA